MFTRLATVHPEVDEIMFSFEKIKKVVRRVYNIYYVAGGQFYMLDISRSNTLFIINYSK